MKIKHFIVTYKNKKRINDSLGSIFNCEKKPSTIYVINNHSELFLNEYFCGKVNVLNNQTRPDFSTGHLSRNWNQAIMNGFKSLSNPDCDFVILSQDDTIFKKDYIEISIELSKKFDFYACGIGDQFMIFKPEAVKKIGLWDERFCNIGYQEADYFLRAVRYNCEKTSINDHGHSRIFNETLLSPIIKTKSGCELGDKSHIDSLRYHNYSYNVFNKKWQTRTQNWDDCHLNELKKIDPKIMSYVMYPYFEKDIETLNEQRYLIP